MEEEITEKRIADKVSYQIEERADGKKYLSYYAIVFNKLSRNMGGWYERILPSAVEGADFSEWVAKKNHNPDLLLGSSLSGTATHTIDEVGVLARVLVGDSPTWQNTISEVGRGDLNFASFEFQTASGGVEWKSEKRDENIEIDVREVKKFLKIWDLSPVVTPAYPDTKGVSVGKREYDQYINQRKKDTDDGSEKEKPNTATEPNNLALLRAKYRALA